jgi:hypothetical protein
MDIPISDFFDGIINSLKNLVSCPGVIVLLAIGPMLRKWEKGKKNK